MKIAENCVEDLSSDLIDSSAADVINSDAMLGKSLLAEDIKDRDHFRKLRENTYKNIWRIIYAFCVVFLLWICGCAAHLFCKDARSDGLQIALYITPAVILSLMTIIILLATMRFIFNLNKTEAQEISKIIKEDMPITLTQAFFKEFGKFFIKNH